jgi:ribosome-binding protein aMBF1 (putative translation factor)
LFTSYQLRAARAILRWSIEDLSQKTGIGTTTLKRFESGDGVPNGHLRNFETIKGVLEKAGIEFLGSPDEGAGVRWKPKSKKEA